MRVLLVEDEPKLARAIKSGLEIDGYNVENVSSGNDALAFLEYDNFDLVILDRMLEGQLDGIEVCERMRKNNDSTPVLMLTALNEVQDRVSGLDMGADDYLGKPFEFDELLARIRALIRRPQQSLGPILEIDGFKIDLSKKEINFGDERIQLSKKEYLLFEYLILNIGTIVSKEIIIERVWDYESDILPNTVEATIKNIRKKLEAVKKDSGKLIETVRGFGYKINAIGQNNV